MKRETWHVRQYKYSGRCSGCGDVITGKREHVLVMYKNDLPRGNTMGFCKECCEAMAYAVTKMPDFIPVVVEVRQTPQEAFSNVG